MSPERSDDRAEGTRNPIIDLPSFIFKNYKDLIAALFIIICIFIYALKDGTITEGLKTLLITISSGSLGYIFGKQIN
jgi:hypothetical protein